TNPSESVSWLSFDGNEGLSSHELVQQVQRAAFQQGKQRDDEWVADFAATSFSGEALEWYVSLDEETQTSWRKLRAGLIQRWPVNPERTASGAAYLDPAATPRPTLYRAPAEPPFGLIKVQRDNKVDMGYLAPGTKGRCIIQTEAAKALVITTPQQAGPEEATKSIPDMPYLGVSLLRQLGKNPDFVPAEIPYKMQGPAVWAGEPVPSSLCNQLAMPSAVHPIATWYINPCSRDPPGPWRKRTSAELSFPATTVFAWILDSVSLELTAAWLLEDGTLDDLV
ncbi:hypothetical protein FS837_008133, partial [Tulasnella sp. UAMH 9824]